MDIILIAKENSMYYVYILECNDGTYYSGYTNDLKDRIEKHNNGKGAKYTSYRAPVTLKYYEEFESKSEAMKREYALKQLKRSEKIELMNKE